MRSSNGRVEAIMQRQADDDDRKEPRVQGTGWK
jgi:hypothetical protein